jgi:hypothetical protein
MNTCIKGAESCLVSNFSWKLLRVQKVVRKRCEDVEILRGEVHGDVETLQEEEDEDVETLQEEVQHVG